MKVWPPGKLARRGSGGAGGGSGVERPWAGLGDWVIRDEKVLVDSRFGGDRELYCAWRDHLWTEIQEALRDPGRALESRKDDTYVVMTAFAGDWEQYRICRDRLREELWQIMKVIERR